MDNPIHPSAIGTAVAVVIAASTGSTLWWMLHPPASYVQKMAAKATSDVARLAGSIMVVFSPEIDSAHMMAFAAKIARGQKTELLALYVIEVPFTLPPNAEMPLEDRAALYRPGWYATWNQVDDDKMDALSPIFHLERVAAFMAFDDPERNLLILYRLDPPVPGQPGKKKRRAIPKQLQTKIGQQPSASQLKH